MNEKEIRNIVEAALMVAQRPLSLDSLLALFGEAGRPERSQIRAAIESLREQYQDRGIELVEVAGGYRIQVRQRLSEWVSRLWEERPPRYSRALLETLALIAYRQPITRGEIEDVRGVSVSTNIIRTLLDRGWVRVLGHRDVPGKPAMYGTSRDFLDYFGLKRLDDLPSLAELRDIDSINVELDLGEPAAAPREPATADGDEGADETGRSSDTLGAGVGDAAGPEAASGGDAEDDGPVSESDGRPAHDADGPDAEGEPEKTSDVVELPVAR
jgi:segregation and condensation protein B